MGDEKSFRRELNSVFDQIAGPTSPALADRVRSSVKQGPEARGSYWIAAVAACVIAVLLVGILVVANPLRRPSVPVRPGPIVTTPSPAASPFICNSNYGPTSVDLHPLVAYVSDVRTGTHPGYDRITITFNNGGPHSVEVRTQNNATFTEGASGRTVTLRGDSGLQVIITGADEHTAYSGSLDFKTGYSKLVEARQVEDFEGVVQWGLGVSGSACYRVFSLGNPDRVVIDVQTAL